MNKKLLDQALGKHAQGDLPLAESLYRSVLEENAEQPDAIHYLGILLHQKDGSDVGLELVLKSLRLAPFRADWHNDLGNILTEKGRYPEAAQAFLNAVELIPDTPGFWNNLGSVLEKMERYEEAESAYRKAVEFDPEFADGHHNLGKLLDTLGRNVEAARHHCMAYVLEPLKDKPKSMLGIAYCNLGRIEEAAEIYRQWMLEEPDNPVPRHLYASCSGKNVPERASDAYIEKTFDEFSENFDVKMEQLSYQGHDLIHKALADAVKPGRALDGLDAGCGTGLCGPLIRPYLVRLDGVDLSASMLDAARRRGVYDGLTKMELTRYLADHPGAFDLIVSADTLIYFGELGGVLKLARRALRTGGLLIFTTEEAEESGSYSINPHGRYSHGREYLREAMARSGFDVMALESCVTRFEFGEPVNCLAVTASAR